MNTPIQPPPPENENESDSDGAQADPPACPACGTPIPPGAPAGICPRCILAGVAQDYSAQSTVSLFPPRFTPPAVEELNNAFSQLEVIELIGSGGMGAVYKARQPHLDRFVALKILPQSLAEHPSFTERFTREARVLAKLSHPNIVGVHDFGEASGFCYLLMEYVDGVNLREAMRAGRFTPGQALDVVPKICEALQFAHDAGVLHRDIKPENILLDTTGGVMIADFGIAKLIGKTAGDDPTLTGSLAPGTPAYMAPEQIEQATEIDHRADIYSLGVVFYEMLTGELPIGRFAPPSEKTTVDSEVDSIVFRTLEKERDRRQQSADEVKTQVEDLDPSASSPTPPPPLSPPSPPPASPSTPTPLRTSHAHAGSPASHSAGKAALLLSIGLVLLIAAAAYFFNAGTRHNQRAAHARQVSEMIATMEVELRTLEKAQLDADAVYKPNHPVAVQAREQAAQLRFQVEDLRKSLPPRSSGTSWRMIGIGGPFIFLVAGILLVFLIITPTVKGWKSLRQLRLTGQHRGRISAAFAALLVPLLILDALIFLLIAGPATGSWQGPAISLAGILIIAADIWIVHRLWQWLKTPLSPEERAEAERLAAPGETNPSRSTNRVIIWIVVAILCIPVLFLGGCAVLLLSYRAVSYESNSFGPDDIQRLDRPSHEQVLPASPKATEAPSSPPSKPQAEDPFGSPSNPKSKRGAKPGAKPKSEDPFG